MELHETQLRIELSKHSALRHTFCHLVSQGKDTPFNAPLRRDLTRCLVPDEKGISYTSPAVDGHRYYEMTHKVRLAVSGDSPNLASAMIDAENKLLIDFLHMALGMRQLAKDFHDEMDIGRLYKTARHFVSTTKPIQIVQEQKLKLYRDLGEMNMCLGIHPDTGAVVTNLLRSDGSCVLQEGEVLTVADPLNIGCLYQQYGCDFGIDLRVEDNELVQYLQPVMSDVYAVWVGFVAC